MWITFLIGIATWNRAEALLLRNFGSSPSQLSGWVSVAGIWVWVCLCMFVLGILFFAVIHKGMDLYDERVFKRVFSPEEWDDLVFLNDRSVHGDEAVERIYRAKGL